MRPRGPSPERRVEYAYKRDEVLGDLIPVLKGRAVLVLVAGALESHAVPRDELGYCRMSLRTGSRSVAVRHLLAGGAAEPTSQAIPKKAMNTNGMRAHHKSISRSENQ